MIQQGLPDNVLLDEACVGIGNALNAYLRTNVIAATMTDLLREHYDRMRKRSNPFFPLNLEVKHEL